MNYKKELENHLSRQLKQPIQLEIPPNNIADFALHSYKLNRRPEELLSSLKLPKFVSSTSIAGPYLNFHIKQENFAESTLNSILKHKHKKTKTRILLEHTSINPNASPHVGRARNAIIGDSIARILRFQGNKVKTHFYVNDIGKQIAMLVLASKNKIPSFSSLLVLYSSFYKNMTEQKEKEVLDLLSRLESGDKKVRKKFKNIVAVCVNGQKRILKELGITFDYFDYESKYLFSRETNNILKKLKTEKDEHGRTIINLDSFNIPTKTPIVVLTRADSTSLYILRDMVYTLEKLKKSKNNLIILGEDQKVYFQQLKAILSMLNAPAPTPIHYSFILLKEGKMSTRSGNVVLLEELMEKAVKKAKEEIKKRKKTKPSNKLAKQIAYGAIKYSILKVANDKNIMFDLDQSISFDGDTAPYIQYAYVRASSILKKAKPKRCEYEFPAEIEARMIKHLAEFQEAVQQAALKHQPHIIAGYAHTLAHLFSEFYHLCPVLTEEPKLRNSRLTLLKATSIILKSSLNLLGIEAPAKM